jgi:hypothetical protein
MNSDLYKPNNKSGAALVIALGFLAILTILIIAFSSQTRTERLAGRGFLSKAQTRHLLSTALTRAMEDIEATDEPYPEFLSRGSLGQLANDGFLADSVDFSAEKHFIPGPGSPIHTAYSNEFNNVAQWQTVLDADNKPVGRVGYIILNTSGLLDANHTGGLTDNEGMIDYAERARGQSPKEIPLTPELLDELSGAGTYEGWSLNEAGRLLSINLRASTPSLSAALAMVYNRTNAWKRFESLRDVTKLNQRNGILNEAINFRTFSYFQPDDASPRKFMGNSMANLQEATIREALNDINIAAENHDFIIEQLKDYIDADSTPEDSKYSGEPVPLINELLLTCDFQFSPIIEIEEVLDEEGEVEETTEQVVAVAMINEFELSIEGWFPFANATNGNDYSFAIENVESTLATDLFGDIAGDWYNQSVTFKTGWEPGTIENAILVSSTSPGTTNDAAAASNAFLNINGVIDQLSIACLNDNQDTVDLAEELELPIDNAGAIISSNALNIINIIFNTDAGLEIESTNYTFRIGLATIDPRLNWDGLNPNHWVETGDNGYEDSIGEVNQSIIDKLASGPEDEPRDKIYVRNEGVIDSVYEFTYLLFDANRPWHTFQFFPTNDTSSAGTDLNTRGIAERLTASQRSLEKQGWINPNTTISNVLASAFYNMPVDEFVKTDLAEVPRMDTSEARQAAGYVMKNRPYTHRTNVAEKLSYEDCSALIGGNTWENESILRNGMNLFNTRDNTFTILLAAQNGLDRDEDGIISNSEVQATQKAVVYIWRDPVSKKAACTFYGLSDTLQSSLSGHRWDDLLQAFRP